MYGIYQLAKMELLHGNDSRAEQLLQRVSAVMPEYPQLYFDMGQIESNRGKEGTSVFYLGKYNLYLGRIKIAKQYLTRASKDTGVAEKLRAEARALIDKLKDLEKGI
jgi:predicted Zn-dependent protease